MSRHYDTAVIFTRVSDGASFSVSGRRLWDSTYVLANGADFPKGRTASISSYRNGGADGGNSTSGTYDPRVVDFKFNVRERMNNAKGLFDLTGDLTSFFRLHDKDNWLEKYTVLVKTGDKTDSQYIARNGVIVNPLAAPMNGTAEHASASVSIKFDDPYFYATDNDDNGGFAKVYLQSNGGGLKSSGREWDGGAVWDSGKTWLNDSTTALLPSSSINLKSETTVNVDLSIVGPSINPTITNSNGSFFTYLGEVSQGNTLTVAADGTVLLNGFAAPGVWDGALTAPPGNSQFTLSDNGPGNGVAIITIRGGF